ncbi:MAG: STN domain-containing protein [Armatimonadota bacterium]
MKVDRGLLLIVTSLAIVFATASVSICDQQPSIPGSDKIVNLELRDVTIQQAIDAIFQGSNVPYVVRPGLTGKVKELKLRGLTIDDAIRALADAAKANVRIENGVYIIEPKAGGTDTVTRVTIGKRTPFGETEQQEKPATQQTQPAEPSTPTEQQQAQDEQGTERPPQEPLPPEYYWDYFTPGAYGVPYGYYPYYRLPYQLGQIQILGGRQPIVILEPGAPPSALRGRLGGPRRPIVPYGPISGGLIYGPQVAPYPFLFDYPW